MLAGNWGGALTTPPHFRVRSPLTCASGSQSVRSTGYCHGTAGQLANQWMMMLFTLLLPKLIIACLHTRFGL